MANAPTRTFAQELREVSYRSWSHAPTGVVARPHDADGACCEAAENALLDLHMGW